MVRVSNVVFYEYLIFPYIFRNLVGRPLPLFLASLSYVCPCFFSTAADGNLKVCLFGNSEISLREEISGIWDRKL
jgi:hypothetical protein